MKLIAVLSSLLAVAASSYRPNTPVNVRIDVEVEFVERSIQSSSVYRKTFTESTNFNKEMSQLDLGVSGQGNNGPVGGGGSFSMSKMNQAETYSNNKRSVTTNSKTVYQPGRNQILRIITTTVKVNGASLTEVDSLYVATSGSSTSYSALRQMAIDYINMNVKPSNLQNVTTNRITLHDKGMQCQRNHVAFRNWCYSQVEINVRGRGLWGYDGGFYPSPEPYLRIEGNSRLRYKGSWRSETADPSLSWTGNLNDFSNSMEVQLMDDDSSGDHDLMCEKRITISSFRDYLIRYGRNDQQFDMRCLEQGSATLTLTLS